MVTEQECASPFFFRQKSTLSKRFSLRDESAQVTPAITVKKIDSFVGSQTAIDCKVVID